MRIIALLTCFNRKDKTLQCLRHLFEIAPDIEVCLVDDGSNDDTSEAIRECFPSVNIVEGNGNLFWNRGMHLAWQEAAKNDYYDYYLWLNDDVYLYDNFLDELFNVYNQFDRNVIVAGIVESTDHKQILYGGYDENKRLIVPEGKPKQIVNLNGNVVLVSRDIFHNIGNLDPKYHHDLGDVDYGLRATKKGIRVYSTRVPIASGEKNAIKRERLNGVSLQKRFKRLYAPLGSNPNINFYFRKKHKSFSHASFYYVFQHFLNLLPDNLNNLLFGKKYQ